MDDPGICYSLGLSMAFEKNDSFPYYMSKAADLSLMRGDTTHAIFILRNMASASTYTSQSKKFVVETVRRILSLVKENSQESKLEARQSTLLFSYESIIDGFLHLKQLDSAQHYIDKYWGLDSVHTFNHLGRYNSMNTYQALIDYSRTGSFDISKAFCMLTVLVDYYLSYL